MIITNIGAACNIPPAGSGMLDKLITNFAGAVITNWQSASISYANSIFMLLFACEFMYQLAIKKVFTGDIEKLWVFFFTRTVLGLFFAKYVVNVQFYVGIIHVVSNYIASALHNGGINLHPANGDIFGSALTPSMIVGYMSCVIDSVHQVTDGNSTGIFAYITIKFTLALMLLFVFITLLLLAICLIKVFIQTYFLLYVGFILAGFAGSSWTMNYWQKYLQAISQVAIKFIIVSVLLGVVEYETSSWLSAIDAARGDIVALSSVIINVASMSFVLAYLMYTLPEWAAQSLSGEVRVRLDDVMRGVSGFMGGNKL